MVPPAPSLALVPYRLSVTLSNLVQVFHTSFVLLDVVADLNAHSLLLAKCDSATILEVGLVILHYAHLPDR